MDQQEDDLYLIFIQRLFERTQNKQIIQDLIDNGFDQWEQTIELNQEILNEIGFDRETVLNILEVLNNVQQLNKINIIPLEKKENDDKNPLTIQIILSGVNKKKQAPNQKQTYKYLTPEQQNKEFLACLTTLSINNKKLTSIQPCISMLLNLQVLDIFENMLKNLDNLQSLKNLRILYAQDNIIEDAKGIEQLFNLDKIYLDKNCLTNLPIFPPNLTLISLSNQRTKFTLNFSEESFQNLSNLETLICQNSNVINANALGCLSTVKIVDLRNNKLINFDVIEQGISDMKCLEDLDLRGNPITSCVKYRDQIVLLSKSIVSLDGKNILQHERQFILNLGKQKLIKRNQSLGERNVQELKGSSQILKNTQVNGKEMIIHLDFQQQSGINSGKKFYDQKCNTNTKHVYIPKPIKRNK